MLSHAQVMPKYLNKW